LPVERGEIDQKKREWNGKRETCREFPLKRYLKKKKTKKKNKHKRRGKIFKKKKIFGERRLKKNRKEESPNRPARPGRIGQGYRSNVYLRGIGNRRIGTTSSGASLKKNCCSKSIREGKRSTR